ncbi:hypothetical protein LIER_32732 [Lithospermum erythrorhizon]|uniref:Uncharacterized protein n=1 Tax=Lithospermum erythrorhizon TaxID=34254 RepID=A0AAV3RWX1_LITER
MVRYHGKGRGKVYSLSDARTVLHSCMTVGIHASSTDLSNSSREMVDLSMGVQLWRLCVHSRAKQLATFPSDSTSNSQPSGYRSWLNKLFSSDAPRCLPKHGKGKGSSSGTRSASLILKSSSSSNRKRPLEDCGR